MRQRSLSAVALVCLVCVLPTHVLAFDCAKAFLPVDFVICSDPQVVKANETHEAAWYAARSRLDDVQKQQLLDNQRLWLKQFPPTCGIPARGKRPSLITSEAQRCTAGALLARAEFLARYALPSTPQTTPSTVDGSGTASHDGERTEVAVKQAEGLGANSQSLGSDKNRAAPATHSPAPTESQQSVPNTLPTTGTRVATLGPFAHCASVENDDYNEGAIPAQSSGSLDTSAFPVPLSGNSGNNLIVWRCMDGMVLACAIGSDGRACAKMNSGRIPSSRMVEYCEHQPDAESIPSSEVGNSSSAWRCSGIRPVISESYPVDRRGYLLRSWSRLDP